MFVTIPKISYKPRIEGCSDSLYYPSQVPWPSVKWVGEPDLYETHYPMTHQPLTHHIPDPSDQPDPSQTQILSETCVNVQRHKSQQIVTVLKIGYMISKLGH